MIVYVVFKPYDDCIYGVYDDGKEAYKKALALNEDGWEGCGSYKVHEEDTVHPKKVKK